MVFSCSGNFIEAMVEMENVEHGFADSGGVKIHYAALGEGPLLILMHGFPDYWYGWRRQMPALSQHFKTVAIDLRGYNLSDKPEGVENYKMKLLVEDVRRVIEHFNETDAIIAGHDWGGMIAWSFAMRHPEMTKRLVILNLPHPKGLSRELANNPEQQRNSRYARDFQKPEAADGLKLEDLTFWVRDPRDREKYLEAFRNSSIEGMLNYYKANYPNEPYTYDESRDYDPVVCPVLMFHGLQDPYLLSDALSETWNWIEGDLTLVTVPQAGHFVHHDAADLVTGRMVSWLTEDRRGP